MIEVLFDRLVEDDSRTDGEVEAASLFRHRDRHALRCMGVQQRCRQAIRFTAEKEVVPRPERLFEIGAVRLGRGEKETAAIGARLQKFLETPP